MRQEIGHFSSAGKQQMNMGSSGRRRARQIMLCTVFSILLACLIFIYTRLRSIGGFERILEQRATDTNENNVLTDKSTDEQWAGSFLHKKADVDMTENLTHSASLHHYMECVPNQFTPLNLKRLIGYGNLSQLLQPTGLDPDTLLVKMHVDKVPCKVKEDSCCTRRFFFRPGSTDVQVFGQIYISGFMKALYPMADVFEPKYILDAGANAGFSSVLFKLLWPEAVVVSVEPEKGNFRVLKKNTDRLSGVEHVNAGLWGRTSVIGLVGDHGDWGKVFKELSVDDLKAGTKGIRSYSVTDLAKKFGLPHFDLVKIDIEGSEGAVFGPHADLSWVKHAQLISIEVHDYFGPYLGLKDKNAISSRIEKAFENTGLNLLSDNEHVYYMTDDLAQKLKKAWKAADRE